ncbi:uncharacterized protein LOC121412523 [Lytechinus variegatus]|uniref:uncharacterized protein LOC121412523 n=1 Tax=Lytechinus variegatus TaxID=7654 RepID=UPI001BB17C90|nr:uncharacterized protein LOC121412523 [Lytechinus variegatus]
MYPFRKENHLLLFILLTKISSILSNQLSFTEGGQAEILFHYNQKEELDIELRIGNRHPFYQHGQKEEIGLSPKQNKRFSVDIEKHSALGVSYRMYLVRVKIENVSREDAGTYTCSLYRDGVIDDEYTKQVGLNIEFPPGKVDCVLGPSHVDTTNRIWSHLKCAAPIGSSPGLIECYQDGDRVPPWTRPIQNRTTLTQTLWIRTAIPIFCCSTTFDKESDICSCKDYVMDFSPSNAGAHDGQPCLKSTPSSSGDPTNKAHAKQTQLPHESSPKMPDDAEDSTDTTSKESGLAVSLTLAFTVLNTIGIAIMITMNTIRNHNKIKAIKDILSNHDQSKNKAIKVDKTPNQNENKEPLLHLRKRNGSAKDLTENTSL